MLSRSTNSSGSLSSACTRRLNTVDIRPKRASHKLTVDEEMLLETTLDGELSQPFTVSSLDFGRGSEDLGGEGVSALDPLMVGNGGMTR